MKSIEHPIAKILYAFDVKSMSLLQDYRTGKVSSWEYDHAVIEMYEQTLANIEAAINHRLDEYKSSILWMTQ